MENNTTTKEYNTKDGKTIEIYDGKGNIIKLIDYNKSGEVSLQVSYMYDSKGNNIERLVTDRDSKQVRRLTFIFDDYGKEISYNEFDKNNQIVEPESRLSPK